MAHPGESDLLDAQQVADFLGKHRNSVYRMVRQGILTASKVGNTWRFTREEIERLLAGQGLTEVAIWTARYKVYGPNDPLPVEMLLSVPDGAFASSPEDPPAFFNQYVEIVRLRDGDDVVYEARVIQPDGTRALVQRTVSLYMARRALADALWFKLVEEPDLFDKTSLEALYRASLEMYRKKMDLDARAWRKATTGAEAE